MWAAVAVMRCNHALLQTGTGALHDLQRRLRGLRLSGRQIIQEWIVIRQQRVCLSYDNSTLFFGNPALARGTSCIEHSVRFLECPKQVATGAVHPLRKIGVRRLGTRESLVVLCEQLFARRTPPTAWLLGGESRPETSSS